MGGLPRKLPMSCIAAMGHACMLTMIHRAAPASTPGVHDASRGREAISPYSTTLTNAKWELVADLFKRTPGPRGTRASQPPQARIKRSRLEKLYTDGAYGEKCAQDIEHALHIRVEVVRLRANGTIGMLHDQQAGL